ncbi:MAG: ABC transporter substrate-binding protein [Treponema sp.]|nr:ABC transporter substrate-binding protein [Treponema sp.]
MKKLLLAAGILSLAALSFIGCNKKTATTESTEAPSRQASNRTIKVGYAQVGHEAAWRNANSSSFKTTMTPANGYDLTFVDADGNQEVQIAAIRDFIAQNVDYIVVAPVVETGWDEVLKEAKAAAIPVILSDRQMQLEDDSLYLCWVGGNFFKEGEDAVKWLEEYLEGKNLASEEINIVDLQGTIGASAQVGRTQGIELGIAEHPNWNLIAQKSGDFRKDMGKTVMEEIIREVGIDKIDVLFAENDDMALGALEAIKAEGKKPGEDIIIISFDAGKEVFTRIIAGEINCACECNPLHGPRVAQIIETLENGGTVEKIQYVDEGVFDQSNAAAELPNRLY